MKKHSFLTATSIVELVVASMILLVSASAHSTTFAECEQEMLARHISRCTVGIMDCSKEKCFLNAKCDNNDGRCESALVQSDIFVGFKGQLYCTSVPKVWYREDRDRLIGEICQRSISDEARAEIMSTIRTRSDSRDKSEIAARVAALTILGALLEEPKGPSVKTPSKSQLANIVGSQCNRLAALKAQRESSGTMRRARPSNDLRRICLCASDQAREGFTNEELISVQRTGNPWEKIPATRLEAVFSPCASGVTRYQRNTPTNGVAHDIDWLIRPIVDSQR